MHGELKLYHDNGQLKQVGKYVKGEMEGEWKFYHDNGQLEEEGKYVNGQAEGEEIIDLDLDYIMENISLIGEEEAEGAESNNMSQDDIDSMFIESARIVVINQQGSASLLQRKLKLGYNRAGRIIDQLEDHGVIGPFQGANGREVLIKDEMQLDELLKSKGLL